MAWSSRCGPLRVARPAGTKILQHVGQNIWRKFEGAVEGVSQICPPGSVLGVKVVADRPCGRRERHRQHEVEKERRRPKNVNANF